MLEDDRDLSDLVSAYLAQEFMIDCVYTVNEANAYIQRYDYDVAVLDRNIDGDDVGLGLVDLIKTKNPTTGVIVVSAYGAVSDKIEGLNVGADDYLEKPFDNDELLARIYALSRRNSPQNVVSVEGIECDLTAQSVVHEGKNINLSKKESDLLFFLLKNRNRIFSSDELLDALYLHPEELASSTIRVTITNIRKKLPIDLIKTIKTRGYTIET